MTFNKQQSEYNLTELKLTHSFALKMASIISFSVVTCVCILGMFAGTITTIGIGMTIGLAIILGLMAFNFTRAAII